MTFCLIFNFYNLEANKFYKLDHWIQSLSCLKKKKEKSTLNSLNNIVRTNKMVQCGLNFFFDVMCNKTWSRSTLKRLIILYEFNKSFVRNILNILRIPRFNSINTFFYYTFVHIHSSIFMSHILWCTVRTIIRISLFQKKTIQY